MVQVDDDVAYSLSGKRGQMAADQWDAGNGHGRLGPAEGERA
jgi:hypothetical protein